MVSSLGARFFSTSSFSRLSIIGFRIACNFLTCGKVLRSLMYTTGKLLTNTHQYSFFFATILCRRELLLQNMLLLLLLQCYLTLNLPKMLNVDYDWVPVTITASHFLCLCTCSSDPSWEHSHPGAVMKKILFITVLLSTFNLICACIKAHI